MAPHRTLQLVLAFLVCLAVLAVLGIAPMILIAFTLMVGTAILAALMLDTDTSRP
ncbi:hypothetical protein [Nocardia cyriacigeorgica]|uniref:hypothetical protein n=1 Tax=Nocardia cyriacigeorgica TaxID=135487 RepID=UPI0024590A94|nr:hypothetical protein [Nocardia cyriacigeorgica]